MKKRIAYIVFFVLILSCVVLILNFVLKKKYRYKDDQASMEIALGFYDEPEDTLDVLYYGSSYVRNAISPLEIWNMYGITGYSRACSQQAPAVSYYLMKEAFRTQSPKVVVYEVAMMIQTETTESNDYDQREAKMHEAIDYMHWGTEKIELAKTVVNNSNLGYLDILFPFYRYHDRWADLSEQDFSIVPSAMHYAYKGNYPALTSSSFVLRPDYMVEGSNDENAQLDPVSIDYVLKMKELCQEKGAELLLVRAPNVAWDDHKHSLIKEFADKNELPFLDYCTKELQNEIHFDPQTDTADQGSHCNLKGAIKLSRHLGAFLRNNYHIKDKRDNPNYVQWEKDYSQYSYELLAKEVVKENNILDYLDLINKPNYLVMVVADHEAGQYFTEDIYEKMKALGFKENLSETLYSSYIGISDGGKVLCEKIGTDPISYSIQHKDHYISLMSDARRGSGSSSSIMIDNEEYALQYRGLNFVIYDTVLDRCLDSKVFNIGINGRQYSESQQFPTDKTLKETLTSAMSDRYVTVMTIKAMSGHGIPKEAEDVLHSFDVTKDFDNYDTQPGIMIWDDGILVYEAVGGKNDLLYIENEYSDVRVKASSGYDSSEIFLNEQSAGGDENGIALAIYDKYEDKIAGRVRFPFE